MKKCLFLFVLFSIFTIELNALDTLKLSFDDNSEVIIIRDDYGVPHIFAQNENLLFFAQGFAQAHDRALQMEMFRRRALGRLTEIQGFTGDDFEDLDMSTKQYYYTNEEYQEIFNNLDSPIKNAIQSFSDGINRYLDSAKLNPAKYKHQTVNTLETFFQYKIEPWQPTHTIAIMVMFARIFGQAGGEELWNQSRYDALGKDVFDLMYPLNDPEVYTTIEDEPAGSAKPNNFNRPNMNINIEALQEKRDNIQRRKEIDQSIGIPLKFGSFALIANQPKTTDGSALHFGAPQMAYSIEIDEYPPVSEVELKCPGFHVGGISVTGIPFVIIGRTPNFAWTFTSGLTDNTDTFILQMNEDNPMEYYYNGEYIPFEVRRDSIVILSLNGFSKSYETEYFDVYRSVYGPVDFIDEDEPIFYSQKMTHWKKEHIMWELLYYLNKSEDINDNLFRFEENPMSFNFLYSGNDGDIKYWHLGHYPLRAEGVDPRLPAKGDGTEDWLGLMPFDELPQQDNPSNGYFINWNNKPAKNWDNGDNIPWTTRSFSGTIIEDIVDFINEYPKLDFETLKTLPKFIEDNGSYQQVLRFENGAVTNAVNQLPPGQSEFIDINGNESPNLDDQYQLYLNNEYKPWLFGMFNPTSVIDDLLNTVEISIYPVPADDFIYIQGSTEISKIEISNILGKTLLTINGTNINKISTSSLSAGVYLISIYSDEKFIGTKLFTVER